MVRVLRSLLFVSAAVAVAQAAVVPSDIDATVERVRHEFNVPGISVAVVKDGRVVFAKGYGVRRLGDSTPMDENTLVGIASNTKAFTSASLAMLVAEGKLSWDDRVVDKLPGFQMSDPYVTHEMRIRDLPCHRSGLALGAGDLMFWPSSNLTSADVLYRLRFVPLATSFRSSYAYDNILYNVIGSVIEAVSGKSWSDFIRERFLKPLGMTATLTSITQLRPGDNAVAPHALVDGVLKPLEHEPLDNNAPAGAIVSSASDMTKWVITLLNKGVMPNGQRLLREEDIRTLWTPLIFEPNGKPPAALAESQTNFRTYAMGEEIREYRGKLLVTHTGGLAGMVTEVSMMPDENLGVIVLTNQEQGGAFQSITNTIFDQYLQPATPKDWVAGYLAVKQERETAAKKTMGEAAAKRLVDAKPVRPLSAYVGRYRDPWYGDVFVTEANGVLTMRFSHSPKLTGKLEPWQYDTFIARWRDRSLEADSYVNFQLDPDGKVEQIRMKAVSPLTDFSFDFHDLRLTPVAADAKPW